MREQHIHGDVGQLVGGDVHVHAPRRARPTDPETARVCPQCGELTWRLTRHCGTCELDLVEWDAHQRRARHRAIVRRRFNRLAAGLAMLGLMCSAYSYSGAGPFWGLAAILLLGAALRAWGEALDRR